MNRLMLVAATVMLPVSSPAAEIPPELWDRPRSAQTVMASSAIRQAVAAYHGDTAARIMIVHGPRQAAQAEELRAWLVALAIDSARVFLRADPAAGTISMETLK
ncbi:MAG: hypothetical protein AB7E73_07500 [Burkholderiales bacterium]